MAFDQLLKLYASASDFKEIWDKCVDHQPYNDFHIVDGFLIKSDVLCVPHTSLRKSIIHEIHSGGLGGYFGRDTTLNTIASKYFLASILEGCF